MPQYSRWMKLPLVRQASVAAGRRSGNSSLLPPPEPILAAMSTTMARKATSNGHDVDQADGAWLGAHAFLRPKELARISWEWMTSDGNGNPDRTATVLQPVEESRAAKSKEHDETVIIDMAAPVRALLRLRALRVSTRSRLIGVPAVFRQACQRATSESKRPSGNKCLMYCGTREPRQAPGPRDCR